MFRRLFQWIAEPLNNTHNLPQNTVAPQEGLTAQDKSFYQEQASRDKKVTTHTVSLFCPTCNKSFNHTFNIEKVHTAQASETISINTQCPSCGIKFNGTIQKLPDTWTCDYCSRKFQTKEATEEHEKSCPMNKL